MGTGYDGAQKDVHRAFERVGWFFRKERDRREVKDRDAVEEADISSDLEELIPEMCADDAHGRPLDVRRANCLFDIGCMVADTR